MNRKRFLQTIGMAAPGAFFLNHAEAHNEPVAQPVWSHIPRYLQPGDTIAITCPASPVLEEDINNCIGALQAWGFKIKIGRTVGRVWERFGGTDEDRLADLQDCLDDDQVAAILFGRGGYGIMRIMDKIKWEKFLLHPKWLVGFSDITALHCHLHKTFHIASIHGNMATGFKRIPNESNISIRKVLSGIAIHYDFEGCSSNKPGLATGELIGGNLSLLYAMQASKSELSTDGKILFIEDVSEYKYNIDRMLMNLKRSGKLEKLAALVVGGLFSEKPEKETDFLMPVEEIVLDKVKDYAYPVCFNFPSGHQQPNLALKLGMHYQLAVSRSFCNLAEMPLLNMKSVVTVGSANSL